MPLDPNPKDEERIGRELPPEEIPPEEQHMGATRLARRVFLWFVLTFAASRIMALLMLTGRLQDFYLRVGQTHVHHLNYGIFLLSAVGGYLIFFRPDARGVARASILYGIGLALTFDEFGMWLHLEDVYWQRASFDAMVLIASILGLIMAAPTLRAFHLKHWIWAAAVSVAVIYLTMLLIGPLQRAHRRVAPYFRSRPPAADSTLVPGQPPAGPSQPTRK